VIAVWRLGALLLAVLVLSGCRGGGGDDEPTVVAAFYPLAWAAEEIAGDDVEVVNLTPPGAEPHDIELTARDIERIDDGELVFYLGQGFMPALEDAVEGHAGAVDLLEGQSLREGTDEHGHGGEGETGEALEGGEEELERDPHVWLDPTRLATIARTIAAELGEPGAEADLVAELEQLDEEYRAGLANCMRREIVTSHAAFGYLADAYGLRQIALSGVSPEAEPSPRALEELVDEVKEEGATTVLFETLVSPRLAETVAREAGADTAVLDPLEGLGEEALEAGADYFSVMRTNLATLRTALDCR
jgi:zinc transport system substrate-binding protein